MTFTHDALGRVLAALQAQGCRPRVLGDGRAWLADCPGCGERALIISREGFEHVGQEAPDARPGPEEGGTTPASAQGATRPEKRAGGGTRGERGA